MDIEKIEFLAKKINWLKEEKNLLTRHELNKYKWSSIEIRINTDESTYIHREALLEVLQPVISSLVEKRIKDIEKQLEEITTIK